MSTIIEIMFSLLPLHFPTGSYKWDFNDVVVSLIGCYAPLLRWWGATVAAAYFQINSIRLTAASFFYCAMVSTALHTSLPLWWCRWVWSQQLAGQLWVSSTGGWEEALHGAPSLTGWTEPDLPPLMGFYLRLKFTFWETRKNCQYCCIKMKWYFLLSCHGCRNLMIQYFCMTV